jgi:hypothetical protein
MTLGQTLNLLLGFCLLLLPNERRHSADQFLGLPPGPKVKRNRMKEVGTTTSENPHAVLYLVPQSSLPHPHTRFHDPWIPPFLFRSSDLSTYLILSGEPSSI